MNQQIVIAGPTSQMLAVKIAKLLNCSVYTTDHKTFPDGENYVRIQIEDESEFHGKDVILVQSTAADATGDQNQHIMELIMMISSVKRMQADKIRVVVPYLAYARQDKNFRPGECLFSQELLRMIEHAGATEFYTVDIHADHVFKALSVPTHNLNPMESLAAYINSMNLREPVVICPDKGAYERSRSFAQFLGDNIPVIQFEKKRDVKTGEIVMQGDASVEGKDVIIADDIIATGGTMALALKIAKQGGARQLYAIGTHPLLTDNAVFRIMSVGTSKIIGTDSLTSPVMDVSLATLIADAIKEN